MKKLSEVCKIVGVTRRTLQEYDRIDLLHPTVKAENGYWFYDNDAIGILITIKIFREVGYQRERIKQILTSKDIDLIKEYDSLISVLKEKQRTIDGMINTIEMLKGFLNMPPSTLSAYTNLDPYILCSKKSYSEYLRELIDDAANFSDKDIQETSMYLPLFYTLCAVGQLKDYPADCDEVQKCVEDYLRKMIDPELRKIVDSGTLTEDEKDEMEDLPEEVLLYMAAWSMLESLDEWFFEIESEEQLKVLCGDGAKDFIKRAFEAYCSAHKFIEEKYDYLLE